MKKIILTMKSGDIIEFDTVPELMHYISEYRLIRNGTEGSNLLKLWNLEAEYLEIETDSIETILIRDLYYVEIRYEDVKFFHTQEEFKEFMYALGCTKTGGQVFARYGIYPGEVYTHRYDCTIKGV